MTASVQMYRNAYWKEDVHYKAHKRMLWILFASILLAVLFFGLTKVVGLMGTFSAIA